MEYIKSWLKTILYMNVLLLICDNLMQKTAYEKYYRFFSGFLLVLCLLKPVIDFAGTEAYFHASVLQEQWKNEQKLLMNSKELGNLEASVRRESEAAYKNQIRELADNAGIQESRITVRWDGAREKIKKIELRGIWAKEAGKEAENSEKKEKLKKVIGELYDLKESDICIEVE